MNWLDEILKQHKLLEKKLDQAIDCPCRKCLLSLTNELSKHTQAEEMVIYPAIKSEESQEHLYLDQAEAKIKNRKIDDEYEFDEEDLDDIVNELEELKEAIVKHMESEEKNYFPKLYKSNTDLQNDELLEDLKAQYNSIKNITNTEDEEINMKDEEKKIHDPITKRNMKVHDKMAKDELDGARQRQEAEEMRKRREYLDMRRMR